MKLEVKSAEEMQVFGEKIGRLLGGGEVIELIGDVGAGKTTFVNGLARGLEITDRVQSPTFTISRVYDGRSNIRLAHYDFYRLQDAGIMSDEISEVLQDPQTVTVIEWGGAVEGVLPVDRLAVSITSPSETARRIDIHSGGDTSSTLLRKLA